MIALDDDDSTASSYSSASPGTVDCIRVTQKADLDWA